MKNSRAIRRGVVRASLLLHLLLFIGGAAVIAASAVFIASQPRFRVRFDATKTRAYALSESTLQLLASLEGEWSVSLIMIEADADAAVVRQVDEVLERYAAAAPDLQVNRIDPSEPDSIAEYEALLSRLETAYADRTAAWNQALDAGMEAFAMLQTFAAERSTALQILLGDLPEDAEQRSQLEQLLAVLTLLVDQGPQLEEVFQDLRRTTPARPIPDYETARSALHDALSNWSAQLYGVSRLMERWSGDPEAMAQVRVHGDASREAYVAIAQRLRNAQDELARLQPLELAEIGEQLSRGEAAIVMGPDRAAVIPSWQLFPRVNIEQTVRFDRRFRGEQVISAAIRSLMVEQSPMVIFVHAEGGTLLRPRQNGQDLYALAEALRIARFEVREWIIGAGDRPAPQEDQPRAWVIVPPFQIDLEVGESEQALLAETQRLLADGESVLLTFVRSLLPVFRQKDPWSTIAQPLGITVDTGRVVFTAARVAEGASVIQPYAVLRTTAVGHPVAAAIDGQALFLDHPTPIQLSIPGENAVGEPPVTAQVIAAIEPSPRKWLEDDWRIEGGTIDEPPEAKRFDQPQPVIVAVSRKNPLRMGRQRLLAVGSGGWMLTTFADQAASLGGGRMMLEYPGNRALLLAAAAWLAGEEQLISAGAVGRETSRLEGVTPSVRFWWSLIALVVLPGACLLLGAVVWIARRRGS